LAGLQAPYERKQCLNGQLLEDSASNILDITLPDTMTGHRW